MTSALGVISMSSSFSTLFISPSHNGGVNDCVFSSVVDYFRAESAFIEVDDCTTY
jgi:hypothetical protein